MLSNFLKNGMAAKQSLRLQTVAMRPFAHTKYHFDDEDWEPNEFQVSGPISILLRSLCFIVLKDVRRDSQDQCRGIDQLYANHRMYRESSQNYWCERTGTWTPRPVHPARQTTQVHASHVQMERSTLQVRWKVRESNKQT